MEKRSAASGWPQEAHSVHFPSFRRRSLILPWSSQAAGTSGLVRGSFSLSADEVTEARAVGTLRSHSQAEKRRRERINTHLSTLRRLIPSANKLDKATLLGRVIEHVKDLKRQAFEIEEDSTVPTEVDEVTVECGGNGEHNSKENRLIKASICCDDRPELVNDLRIAIQGLRLRTIRADISTLGGRMRNVFLLCSKDGEENVSLSSVKDSLKSVLGTITSKMSSSGTLSSKRQRVLPSYYLD